MHQVGKRERISNGTFFLMIMVALVFEFFTAVYGGVFFLLGLIPFLGFGFSMIGYFFSVLIDLCGYLSFWMWFKFCGFGLSDMDPEQIAWFYGTAILEATPILGMLPFFTIGVIRTAHLVRKKDREYNKKHAQGIPALPKDRPRHERIRDARLERRARAPRSPIGSTDGGTVLEVQP